MREACNFHHMYTLTMTDKMRHFFSRKSHGRIFYEFIFKLWWIIRIWSPTNKPDFWLSQTCNFFFKRLLCPPLVTCINGTCLNLKLSKDTRNKIVDLHQAGKTESAIGKQLGLKKSNVGPIDNLTPEERDARTVFCMQLAARIRPRDLEEFFSAVGKVRDVRMISDRNSRRSKGIAYIEFVEANSVPLAIGLSGQRLLGVPIIVQASQAEKNRAAAMANNLQKGNAGPMRLYVGSLHFNITEEMLRGIFEPFGKIESIQLMMDSETGRSKGYGFITFSDTECAKKALDQLNGFELAGRPMKVGHVTERTDASNASSFLDNDELERTGIDLGTTGRLQLMARLAEGTGLQIPPAAQQALQMGGAIAIGAMAAVSAAMNPAMNMNMNTAMNLPSQPLATHCFQLSNMFNPRSEDNPGWDVDIQHDVIEECNKHGGVVHIYVDKNSTEGNVYVKCPSVPAAMAAVNALHGRYFAGKMITAAYVPLPTYHNLFPDSVKATQLLIPLAH
uniref:RNA binding motif protein 39a n=1 Tax=Oncorhynchus kisutch TaxID=8019 RepID=A0A8C7HY26_ONCKI